MPSTHLLFRSLHSSLHLHPPVPRFLPFIQSYIHSSESPVLSIPFIGMIVILGVVWCWLSELASQKARGVIQNGTPILTVTAATAVLLIVASLLRGRAGADVEQVRSVTSYTDKEGNVCLQTTTLHPHPVITSIWDEQQITHHSSNSENRSIFKRKTSENRSAHSSDGKDGLLFSPVLGDTGLHEAEKIVWILTFNWTVPFRINLAGSAPLASHSVPVSLSVSRVLTMGLNWS